MKRLPQANSELALSFVFQHGRGLDKALAKHFFKGEGSKTVIDALTEYRNSDGGFGHGLEQDFLLPDSSPMATTIALQTLADIAVPASEPLVVDALNYLVRTHDASRGVWPFAPPSVDEFPHAPWWRYGERSSRDELAMNPSAEIVGYFVRWRSAVPASAPVEEWLEGTLNRIGEPGEIQPHQWLCCVRLAEAPGLQSSYREMISNRLSIAVKEAVQTNPGDWKSYGIKPLTAAPRPDSLLAPDLSEAIENQLEFEIEQQTPEGAWHPHWSWYGSYNDDWERIQPEISAFVTLQTLKALKNWGRCA